MQTGMMPDKMAEYFTNLNSLSSKIFSEVQLIDEAIMIKQKELTFDQRCAVIDKILISDALESTQRTRAIHHQVLNDPEAMKPGLEEKLFQTAIFKDACLDQGQMESMLRFVYPRKPEKYVFDETGCWVDEHSEPFGYFKESQTKCCELESLLQKTLLASNYKILDEGNLPVNARKDKKKSAPFCGVNVMGMDDSHREPLEQKCRTKKSEDKKQYIDEEKLDNLPKQKQNLDLIAELQAKLDKTRSSRNMTCPPPLPPLGSQSPPSGRISKPKAPPPPPPATKVTTVGTVTQGQNKSMSNTKTTEGPEEDVTASKLSEQFVVDVSSPCRVATPKTGFDFLDNW